MMHGVARTGPGIMEYVVVFVLLAVAVILVLALWGPAVSTMLSRIMIAFKV